VEQLRLKQLKVGLLRLVHQGRVPKDTCRAAKVEAVKYGTSEVSSLGLSAKGWSS
jgi:hypothetical protein